jgi:hypothetical protein
MKPRDLRRLGIPDGPAMDDALAAVEAARAKGWDFADLRNELRRVVASPQDYSAHEVFGDVAERSPLARRARGRRRTASGATTTTRRRCARWSAR